jgi:hypothetical protein
VLFTCTLVLSCPIREEGLSMKLESLEQTASYCVGQYKQEECSRNRVARASVQPWIEAMKGIFARCSKKTAVMYRAMII